MEVPPSPVYLEYEYPVHIHPPGFSGFVYSGATSAAYYAGWAFGLATLFYLLTLLTTFVGPYITGRQLATEGPHGRSLRAPGRVAFLIDPEVTRLTSAVYDAIGKR